MNQLCMSLAKIITSGEEERTRIFGNGGDELYLNRYTQRAEAEFVQFFKD